MKCGQVHDSIQLYLDGRLDGQRMPGLAQHLQTCGQCRDELAAYQTIVEGMTTTEPDLHPEALTRSIMLRIRQVDAQLRAPALSRPFSLGWADALLAAALATVMTVVFLFFQPVLRAAISVPLSDTFAALTHTIALHTASWSPLAIWFVWIALGVTLTLWFAGREVRAGWRRTIQERLSR
jgi:anti-sigma factor RsiW